MRRLLLVVSLLACHLFGCAHARGLAVKVPAAVPEVHWFNESAALNPGSVDLFGTVPCGTWLAVESVTRGTAGFRILPHTPQEHEHPYIVGYSCLHLPDHLCPGGENMNWPDGLLGDRMNFIAPNGGPYHVIVAKAVQDETGTWIPTRGCDTVNIPTVGFPSNSEKAAPALEDLWAARARGRREGLLTAHAVASRTVYGRAVVRAGIEREIDRLPAQRVSSFDVQ